MMVIDNKFEIGQQVYLITDTEQLMRIVYRIIVYKKEYLYCLTYGTITSEHYDFEISPEKSLINI
jgi:hypothetical protein